MIYDTIEHIRTYENIPGFLKAIEFIETHDLLGMELGKHEVDGDRVFVDIQEYMTKNPEDGRVETHRNYIDLQIMLKGREYIGYRKQSELGEPVISNPDGDIWFYDAEAVDFEMTDGMFMVLFPHDGHRPQIRCGENQVVNKAVFKIHV